MTIPQVLIAHQGTIPHYRVRFYELLEERRPRDWEFRVVYDCAAAGRLEGENLDQLDWRRFRFPLLDARPRRFSLAGRRVFWQQFFRLARHFDVLITDTHLTNLTYPACTLYRFLGQKQILWGHTRNMNVVALSAPQRLAQKVKALWLRSSDAFFAYTEGSRREIVAAGMDPEKVFVLHNTIDTVGERAAFEELRPRRDAIRREMGLEGRRVLISVGRLRRDKRIAFLMETFARLYSADPSWHLILIGDGPERPFAEEAAQRLGPGAARVLGAVTRREELAPLYVASDLYILTGFVGLGPLQAFCYDLPGVFFDTGTHSPEIEYVTDANAVMLPGDTTEQEAARRIPEILEHFSRPERRAAIYESICHLTLENMVDRFIDGINFVLRDKAKSER